MNIREDFKRDPKRILWCAIALIILIFGYFYQLNSERQKEKREISIRRELAVSTLPEIVERSWMQYIDKRLNEEIQLNGRNLRVRTTHMGAQPSYSYVSINHPYQIDCNTFGMGISINFGEEENSPSANITGYFSPDHKNEPPISVNPNSIAAKALDTRLCGYVANWVAQITSR